MSDEQCSAKSIRDSPSEEPGKYKAGTLAEHGSRLHGDLAHAHCPLAGLRHQYDVETEQGLDPHTVLVCYQLLHHYVLVMRVKKAGLSHTQSLFVHCREDLRFAW